MFRSLFSRDNNKTEFNQRLAHSTGLGSRERVCSEIVFRSYPAHIYWHNKSDCLHRSCCSCILLYAGNKRNVSRELWEKARSVLVFLFEVAKRCVWVYTAFHWPHENTHSLPGLVLFSQPYGLADKKNTNKNKKKLILTRGPELTTSETNGTTGCFRLSGSLISAAHWHFSAHWGNESHWVWPPMKTQHIWHPASVLGW